VRIVLVNQPPAHDSEVSDADLVKRVGDGDAEALGMLYDRYGKPCFSLARRITADRNFGEEVVQEVFLALWRDPTRFDPGRGGFASWLLAMTHHKAVDTVRREETLRRHRAESAEQPEAAASWHPGEQRSVDDQVWSTLRAERVRDALQELPEAQRKALALAYFGGYTQREVAALTGAPLGTVKTRMLAGMRRLKDRLGNGVGLEDGESGS
jgi:RNA polymerase sigma-70 factor (ECF subfamily)